MLSMPRPALPFLATMFLTAVAANAADGPPAGFKALFDGKSLTGWHGGGTENPEDERKLDAAAREAKHEKSREDLRRHWRAEDGELINDGEGLYMTTDADYGDIELRIDYRTVPRADSGIYLRGTPQVQIWDSTDKDKWGIGADKGSGGLWNNSPGAPGKDPLVLADKPFGEWNSFRILQVGARTTVFLNDKLVVDHALFENYFDRARPLLRTGPVQLQTHGGEIRWRNIHAREIGAEEANRILSAHGEDGFRPIFDGKSLTGWAGAVDSYEVVDGAIQCKKGKGGALYHGDVLEDFAVRLEIRLPPGGNNGLAIRYPPGKDVDTAYEGMCELQVLDDSHPSYKDIDPRQSHGSAYGMVAAHRGYLRPAGEWNFQEVTVTGSRIRVELNGTVILDADLGSVKEFMANTPHPGKDRKSGCFGFAGHGDAVAFRNVRVKKLEARN